MAIFLLLFLRLLLVKQASGSYSVELRKLAAANNDFGFKLHNKIAEDEKGNFIFSPLSICLAFAMTSLGAKGSTLQEIHSTIANGIPEVQIHEYFQQFMTFIPRISETENVSIVNKLFGQYGFKYLPSFRKSSKRYYLSNIYSVSFNHSERSAFFINNWISRKTNGKIEDIVHSRDINNKTRLVLADALYFEAPWESAFKKRFTKPQNFFIRPKKPVEIDFLHDPASIGLYGFHNTLNFAIFEKYFKSHSFRFGIILPDLAKTTLDRVEKKLSTKVLKEIKIKKVKANVTIPKFKINSRYELSNKVVALGIQKLFSKKADLSGLEESKRLYLHKAFHKDVIEIDENGAFATAATTMSSESGSIHQKSALIFRADHPFLFFIKHSKTNSILLFGKFSQPRHASH